MNPSDAQHFTSGEWSVLITVLLTGLTTMTVTIINTIKASTTGRKMDGAKAHLEKQDEKLESIHVQTNGNLAATQAQLDVSRREVAELKAAAAAKAEAAAELAAEIRRQLTGAGPFLDRRRPSGPARVRTAKR